jgi:hypothetical protein
MSLLVSITDYEEVEYTHFVSFEIGKTICGVEFYDNDDIPQFKYVRGSIKKVTCPYCNNLIALIKKAR